jgi:hypothetical protein
VNKRVAKKMIKLACPERYSERRVLTAVRYLWRRNPTRSMDVKWLFRKGGKYGQRSMVSLAEAIQQVHDDILFNRHEWKRKLSGPCYDETGHSVLMVGGKPFYCETCGAA